MRYRGQGHEIAVPLPTRTYREDDGALLHTAFEDAYRRLYSRVIPGVEVEVLSWVMLLSAPRPAEGETVAPTPEPHIPEPARSRPSARCSTRSSQSNGGCCIWCTVSAASRSSA